MYNSPRAHWSIRNKTFKERGIRVLQVSPNILSREFRGKKTDFYDAEKLENMIDKAKGYEYNPLRELVTLYLLLIETKYKNRLKRALFLVSDKVNKERLERIAKGDFTQEELYNLSVNKTIRTVNV